MVTKLETINFSVLDVFLKQPMNRSDLLSYFQNITSSDENIVAIQSFRQDSLLNEKHLFSAVFHSWNAFETEGMISKNLSVEFLLYLSGQRQISKALELFGLPNKVERFSVIFFHVKELPKDYITTSAFSGLIKQITNLTISDTLKKRKELASFFNYSFANDDSYLQSEEGFINLQNFILTTISNVVFEA